jgi:hypothetical protein
MATIAFDTLAQADKLKSCGFDERQAKGLIEVIAMCTNDLATKHDIEQIKQEMGRLKLETRLEIQYECNNIRRELVEFKEEVRHEFAEFKEEIHCELGEFKAETRREFASLDKKIMRMTINLSSVMVVALGVYTSILQWLLR